MTTNNESAIELSRSGIKLSGLKELFHEFLPLGAAKRSMTRALTGRIVQAVADGQAPSDSDVDALAAWAGEKEVRHYRNLAEVYRKASELAPSVAVRLLPEVGADDEITVTLPNETWRARFELPPIRWTTLLSCYG